MNTERCTFLGKRTCRQIPNSYYVYTNTVNGQISVQLCLICLSSSVSFKLNSRCFLLLHIISCLHIVYTKILYQADFFNIPHLACSKSTGNYQNFTHFTHCFHSTLTHHTVPLLTIPTLEPLYGHIQVYITTVHDSKSCA